MKKETFIDCYLAVTFNDITNQFEADDQHLFGLRQSHIFKATTFKALEQEIIETYNNDHKLNKIGWYASASTLDIKLFYDFAKNLDLELDEVEMIFA